MSAQKNVIVIFLIEMKASVLSAEQEAVLNLVTAKLDTIPDFTRGGWNKIKGYRHAFVK